MQKGETSRRHGNRRRAKEAGGWAWMGLGRPSPVQYPFALSFALAAIRAIYSPGFESHGGSNSSLAVEEQRREGHHLGEERVELVDKGLPSRRGNLARKTTSEFPELEARSRKDPGGDLVYVSWSWLNYQVESIPSDQVFPRRFHFLIGFAYSNSILEIDYIGCSCSRGG
jgi:hypothetical protein